MATPPTDEAIAARVASERERLLRDAGLITSAPRHFTRPTEFKFTRAQREQTTVLLGGLTARHDRLIKAAWEGLGYRCAALPVPDVNAFQLGKEYGNNGQCNPAYFTVGNLVQFLQRLRDEEGMTVEEIKDRYLFVTAGACGPCRFGMYEAEYRLALRNAGFDGFRVMVFQQSAGLFQSSSDAGLEMNLDFFLGMLNAMMLGDLLQALARQIRPYEVERGATDRTVELVMQRLEEVLRGRRSWWLGGRGERRPGGRLARVRSAIEELGKYVEQLRDPDLVEVCRWARERFDQIAVDRLRVKPIVKITGEFWAQTTEGDGNFNMFRFLEREGAQVLAEPIAGWITYMLHQARQRQRDRRGLWRGPGAGGWRRLVDLGRAEYRYQRHRLRLALAEAIFRRQYERLRQALGGTCHRLPDQRLLKRIGHPYLNSRTGGGEGHLEIAKTIYYSTRGLCHMVLGVKPFGCMPSTQSDGIQVAVASDHREITYLSIETSGEGEVNAHSRVQMALGEARGRAQEEFAASLAATGQTVDEVREAVRALADYQRPLMRVPAHDGTVGVAANLVRLVADRRRGRR